MAKRKTDSTVPKGVADSLNTTFHRIKCLRRLSIFGIGHRQRFDRYANRAVHKQWCAVVPPLRPRSAKPLGGDVRDNATIRSSATSTRPQENHREIGRAS